jgi:cytochrome c biogenesis protein ResB
MHFSTHFAIIFILAGFAAGAYFLTLGSRVKLVPIGGLIICIIYTGAEYGFMYAMLTAIEYAIGFGIAHAVVKPTNNEDGESHEK